MTRPPVTRWLGAGLVATGALLLATTVTAAELPAPAAAALQDWLQAQTRLATWSADFVQTRHLKALTRPIQTPGRLWFRAPQTFRWELGSPAQTIALRHPKGLLAIYPRLKRAEQFALQGEDPGPWRDALALLEAGFPRTPAELTNRFAIQSGALTNGLLDLHLQPLSAGAAQFIPEIRVALRTNDFVLALTELKFSDGSLVRNEFTNAVLNPPLDDDLFRTNLPPDYRWAREAQPF